MKNHEVDAVSVLCQIEFGNTNAATHIFGNDGYHFCQSELIVTWLSLLVLLASSENVTGSSIARRFIKGCAGCMVYTILMVVACFPDKKVTRLAFDFFRHVLGDSKGEILELHEIDQLASLLNQQMPRPEENTVMRSLCLVIERFAKSANPASTNDQMADQLPNLVKGLGALCISRSFAGEMKTNATSTTEVLKESMKNKTFSPDFVRKKWP